MQGQICNYTVERIEDLSVSLIGGVLVVGVSLILVWQKDASYVCQHGVGLSGSVALPKFCLLGAVVVCFGLQGVAQLFISVGAVLSGHEQRSSSVSRSVWCSAKLWIRTSCCAAGKGLLSLQLLVFEGVPELRVAQAC